MQTVVETPDSLRDANDAELTANEQEAIVRFLAACPNAGLLASLATAYRKGVRNRVKGRREDS